MTEIKLKRVYEPEEKSDGYRIFVDKLWPRGVKKELFHYDMWAKNITPSTPLREWLHEDIDKRWNEFEKLYKKELDNSGETEGFINEIEKHKTVTFLYSSKNIEHNHAEILKDYVQAKENK